MGSRLCATVRTHFVPHCDRIDVVFHVLKFRVFRVTTYRKAEGANHQTEAQIMMDTDENVINLNPAV